MKFLITLFFLTQLCFAQSLPTATEPFPSEGSEVVPSTAPGNDSAVKATVEDATTLKSDEILAPESALPSVSSQTPLEKDQSLSSRANREHSTGTVMVGYHILSSWLPFKKSLSYTHLFDKKWTAELEYTWGDISDPIPGIDLGRMKEKRFSLVARRYLGNSFHFILGPYYNDFDASLGSSILNQMSSNASIGFRVSGLGLATGIGNRWQWNNGFTLGLDWIRLNIPLVETRVDDNVLKEITDKSDREDVKDLISSFNNIPTFVLFGFSLGYTF